MTVTKWAVIGLGLVLATGTARAETKVEVKNVHLCCPACVKGVAEALKGVEGVKGACDQKAKTVTLTATDAKAAQKAIDALAAAGYHGQVPADYKLSDDSGAKAEKVKTLTLTGVHNCCGACTRSIQAAVKKVPGVTGDTCKAKADSFDVTGDFDAAAVVKALNDAGFHVKVKK